MADEDARDVGVMDEDIAEAEQSDTPRAADGEGGDEDAEEEDQ